MSKEFKTAPPWVLLAGLLLAGLAAACAAMWLGDHRGSVENSDVFIAVLMLAFFFCWTGALMRYLRWRDRNTSKIMTRGGNVPNNPFTPNLDLPGTVYGLIPGAEYRVVQSFSDFYGGKFIQGEFLRFKERHFLPYHGGHTIVFEQKSLFLQEDESAEILDNFSNYIERIER
jgi:hypothetical protein